MDCTCHLFIYYQLLIESHGKQRAELQAGLLKIWDVQVGTQEDPRNELNPPRNEKNLIFLCFMPCTVWWVLSTDKSEAADALRVVTTALYSPTAGSSCCLGNSGTGAALATAGGAGRAHLAAGRISLWPLSLRAPTRRWHSWTIPARNEKEFLAINN